MHGDEGAHVLGRCPYRNQEGFIWQGVVAETERVEPKHRRPKQDAMFV